MAEVFGTSFASKRAPWILMFASCGAIATALLYVYSQQPFSSGAYTSQLASYLVNEAPSSGEKALRESMKRLQLQLDAFNQTLQGKGGEDGAKCECNQVAPFVGEAAKLECAPCIDCQDCPVCQDCPQSQDCQCPPPPDCPKAGEGLTASSEADVKARVLECFRKRSECERVEDELCEANQLKVQAMRERTSRDVVRGQLNRLYDHPILSRLNITLNTQGYKTAKAAFDNLKESEEDGELWEFVMLYKIHRDHLNRTAEGRAQLDTWVEEGNRERDRASERSQSLEEKLVECKAKLLERCGVQLPLDDWREKQDKLINGGKEKGQAISSSAATAGYEVRLEVEGNVRGGGGLRAPREYWKLQQRLYPDSVNVSFLLQYYDQPGNIKPIVQRLYECTHGWKGDGQLGHGVTSELIVNVDEPGYVERWIEQWNLTDPGSFLVPVFQHNLHENRGFNRAAGVAKGSILILLQDDDIPAEDCTWVRNVLTAYDAWPRLGVIGLKGGVFTIGASSVPRESKAFMGRFASWGDTMIFRDNSTGLRMQFMSVVDLAPMAFRRETYDDVGGMNESNGKKGEPGIMSDWEVSVRVWMGGWHVAQLYLEDNQRFQGGEKPGGTHVGIQAYLRGMNQGLNGEAFSNWVTGEYHERVYQEVKRMNAFLDGPSDPSLYI